MTLARRFSPMMPLLCALCFSFFAQKKRILTDATVFFFNKINPNETFGFCESRHRGAFNPSINQSDSIGKIDKAIKVLDTDAASLKSYILIADKILLL